MSSSNPHSLPTSTSNSNSQPSNLQAQSALASLSLRLFVSRLSGALRQSLSNRRPWTELIDRTAFSRPDSLAEATSRVRKNFSYFRVNYLTILAILVAFSLISHPYSFLILLSLVAAWLFLYTFRPSDQPLVILGRTFSDRETLGALVALTVIVVFLTSVGSLIISTIVVGFAILSAHGAFRVPEDLFLDEQEPLGSGFLSFVGGAASSAAAASGPSRV